MNLAFLRRPLHPWHYTLGFTQTFRRELLDHQALWPQSRDHMSDAVMAHDQWFIFLAAVLGRVAFIEDPLVKHRQHEANTYGVHSVPRWRRLISRFSHNPEWDRLAAIAARSRAGVVQAIDRNRPDRNGPDRKGSLAAIEDGYRTLAKRHERRLETYTRPSLTGRVAALSRAVQERDYTGLPWGLEPKAIARDAVRGALLGEAP